MSEVQVSGAELGAVGADVAAMREKVRAATVAWLKEQEGVVPFCKRDPMELYKRLQGIIHPRPSITVQILGEDGAVRSEHTVRL